ncbi:helix-turn-helix domain-containing protein [Aureimonas sp. SK2]|uniref:helix-turn-helix domain-containing protein n=1 Tax=Aureimonas sp. SK2 TaxID=3015992 RepID=UPI002444FE7F|nr:helix-turn-helix domain-containing protein [Aureimonas sp. SK2]
MPTTVVPRFFLYGEPPRAPEDRFLHMEEIDDRARPAAWRILPHAHADLHQALVVRNGGGVVEAEGETLAFAAPAALLVPAGTVHGFRFEASTAGKVLTLSDPLYRLIVRSDPALGPLFEAVRRLSAIDGAALGERLDALAGELAGGATARRGALVAHATLVLVALARALEGEPAPLQAQPGQHAEIVARFREAVEESFHTQVELDAYCRRLGITMGRLRLACRAVADTTPGRIVADRVILEARRALVYSDRPVSDIAYGLGFADPAYFARAFARAVGQSPTGFRRRSREAEARSAAPPPVQVASG